MTKHTKEGMHTTAVAPALDPPSPTLPPLPAQALHDLRARGAVGEISARFLDTDGRPCSSELDGRLIGLTLTDLRSIPVRVAVARGRERVPAVAAALAGRFANVLVTDVDTAAALIAYASSSQASVGALVEQESGTRGRCVHTSNTEVRALK